jgi:dienelactone hydrolase
MDALRSEIRSFLHLQTPGHAAEPVVHDEVREVGFVRKTISYATADGDTIEAFLFEPHVPRHVPSVVMLHQHNGEWGLGKSEIAGLVGDRHQAFGPVLARAGVVVLAPDAIGFESRCGFTSVGRPLPPDMTERSVVSEGWLQYYNHAMHRLVRGQLLIHKILADVADAVSVVQKLAKTERVGVAGHAYGGNVALFAAALDTRISFACASGAACSYRHKLAHGTGLEMALVIPGFAERFDFENLMQCVAPRELLIVSSEGDPYAADAGALVAQAAPAFRAAGAERNLVHLRIGQGHALDAQRFSAIVDYLVTRSASDSE